MRTLPGTWRIRLASGRFTCCGCLWLLRMADVLDNEGVWNVAQVLAIKTSSSVCVRYDGWGAAYDEDVDLSTGRIAPYHTYTWTVKCWAKYLNWPWWPCVVSIAWIGRPW